MSGWETVLFKGIILFTSYGSEVHCKLPGRVWGGAAAETEFGAFLPKKSGNCNWTTIRVTKKYMSKYTQPPFLLHKCAFTSA